VLEPLSGYLTLCERLYTEGVDYADAWNFGPEDSDAKDVEWIAKRLCTLWQDNASYELDNLTHPHEAFYLKLDCSKAKSRLGWHPRWNIETALSSIVKWNKALQNRNDMRQMCINQIEEYFYSN
jgi:CDP-glucose 4,6-dehydratase